MNLKKDDEMTEIFFDNLEAHLGESVDYLREIKRQSERAFEKFTQVIPLAAHREFISKEADFIAHILATINEDCGSCAQIAVNLAIKDGVALDFIETVVEGRRESLADELKLVYDFVHATVHNTSAQDDLRERVKVRLGAEALVDLGLTMASARIFPTVKRTMGFAVACQRLTVGGETVDAIRGAA